jgi:nitrogen fixation protein NifB
MTTTGKEYCFGDPDAGLVVVPVASANNAYSKYLGDPFGGGMADLSDDAKAFRPDIALKYVQGVAASLGAVKAVCLDGPGEPLAQADKTFEALRLIREAFPDIAVSLTTNGLLLPDYIDILVEAGVCGVSVAMPGADAEQLFKIYNFARPGKKTIHPRDSMDLLHAAQVEGIKKMKDAGLFVKVDYMLVPGVNDGHVEETAKLAAELGVDVFHVFPCEGAADENVPEVEAPSEVDLQEAAETAAQFLPVAGHGDAPKVSGSLERDAFKAARYKMDEAEARPNVAVASDKFGKGLAHLGKAEMLLVFQPGPDGPEPMEARPMPKKGTPKRWDILLDLLKDCRVLVVGSIGEKPREILTENGVEFLETEAPTIAEALDKVF